MYRCAGVLHLDWWYDTPPDRADRGGIARATVSRALIELIREAMRGRRNATRPTMELDPGGLVLDRGIGSELNAQHR